MCHPGQVGIELLGKRYRFHRLVEAAQKPEPGPGDFDEPPVGIGLVEGLPTTPLAFLPVVGSGGDLGQGEA
jgi:hypothetical protein